MNKTLAFDGAKIDKGLKGGSPATETIDGVECRHLVLDLAHFAGEMEIVEQANTTGEMHVWINTESDPLLRRMRIEGKSGGQPVTALLEWSRFSDKVEIEAPANLAPTPAQP
jgi:hypothetical protein